MLKILLLSLLVISMIAAEATPSTAAAKAVSDILSQREDVVKKADTKAIRELKSLLFKFKKDKASSILIAVKLHKISADDADAIAILKDVPAGDQDLLGDVGEPGKYLTDVQAKVIADALAKGKFTGKDWDALPGKIVEVKPEGPGVKVGALKKGTICLIVPNPDDKWRSHETSPWTNYKGEGPYQILKVKTTSEKGDPQELRLGAVNALSSDTILSLAKSDAGGTGSIRVKVYEVVSNE
jgi:hypothetical protein